MIFQVMNMPGPQLGFMSRESDGNRGKGGGIKNITHYRKGKERFKWFRQKKGLQIKFSSTISQIGFFRILICENMDFLPFTAKTRNFQGCLGVWSREDQALENPCKLRNLAIFYNAKKIPKFPFSIVFTIKIGWIESTSPPSNIRVKTALSKVSITIWMMMNTFQLKSSKDYF